MQQQTFADKFLKHLDKIDRADIEAFIMRTVRERDFVARLFDVLIEGIVVVDGEFRVTMLNTAARRILRLGSRKRIAGEYLPDLLDSVEALRRIVVDFADNPAPILDEEIVLNPESRRTYSLHLLPIGGDEAAPQAEAEQGGAALILHDVTPTREKQARDAQAEKIASLATLTAGVAHEIKNPLNSLSIHAQLLERDVRELAPQGSEAGEKSPAFRIVRSCAVIAEEVDRLRKCVDDFIEAARPSRPRFQPMDLNRIVRSVVEMAALEFDDRGIQIETVLDPDLPVVRVDEKLVQNALRNLIRNAVDAIEAARRPAAERRISLRTLPGDETAILEISDNGCGIPHENLTKIFEPYYTTKFNGSGLGLMAVARIVRDHEGRLAVESHESDGATFTLEFPAVTRRVKLLEGGQGIAALEGPETDTQT